jgi:hypothetical protein
LKSLQPNVRALVIILEAKAMFIEGHQMVFEGCFQNTNEDQIVSRLFDEVGHYFWFQGPLNNLGDEWRATYIVRIFIKFLSFCMYKLFSC